MAEYKYTGKASDHVHIEPSPFGRVVNSKIDEPALFGAGKIDVGISIDFNPIATISKAWSYTLRFPEFMGKFFSEAGLTGSESADYNGGLISTFDSADIAQQYAEAQARRIVARYKNYLDAKTKAKTYTYTVEF